MKELALIETFKGFIIELAIVSKNIKLVTFYYNKSGIIFGIGIKSVYEIQYVGLVNGLLKH